jgi:hypothetical protein
MREYDVTQTIGTPIRKLPQLNAYLQRFTRTIEEALMDHDDQLLLFLDQFNCQLISWLIWYNAERSH